MRKLRVSGLGLIVTATVATSVFAQAPATDGLKWLSGSPSTPLRVTTNLYDVVASAEGDTAKYPQIQVTGLSCFMEVVKLDKDGKQVGDPYVFKGTVTPAGGQGGPTGTCQAGTVKIFDKKTGKETEFPGFPEGKYKVKLQTRVKETPTSPERDAEITITIDVPRPLEPGEPLAINDSPTAPALLRRGKPLFEATGSLTQEE